MVRASRTYRCDVETLVRLLNNSGWTLKQLADASDVDEKTISRMLKGEPKLRSIIALVAKAFAVEPETLILNPARESQLASMKQPLNFQLQLCLGGNLHSPEQAKYIANLLPDLIADLKSRGMTIDIHQSTLVVSDPADSFGRRVVELIAVLGDDFDPKSTGLESGFWYGPKYGYHLKMLATIRPSKYAAFLETVSTRKFALTTRDVAQFGEVIDTLDQVPLPELFAGRFKISGLAARCHSFFVEPTNCVLPDGRTVGPGEIMSLRDLEIYLQSCSLWAD